MPSNPDSLFEKKYKECSICHKPLPLAYEYDLCPACEEQNLFARVRDFIRENDVNEYQVAEYFDIPVRQVKDWIREGRIEYRAHGQESMSSVRCQRCGAPVSFGTLCPKCLKLLNGSHGYGKVQTSTEERMRFVNKDEDE